MIDEKISWLENFALENSPDHCKYLIALAERDRVNGNVWSAVCNYESAIENARRHDATLWEALATELLAKLFLLQGNKRLAKHCINSALNVWKLWGSQAKINQLKAQFPDLVDQAAFTAQEVSFGSFKQHKATSSTPSNSLGNNFDVTTLLKVTQSITNESNLEELLKKILSYIMVNASAKKGVLLINDNRKLFVQAYASDDHETKIISPPRELENLEGDISLPISIILFVYRSREVVVLSDAIHDNVYQNDSYVKANLSKSILCVPIVHQNTVNGVI